MSEINHIGITVLFFLPNPNCFKLPSVLYKKAGFIICIDIILLIIIVRSNNYKAFFFICIFGGSLGNLFDRLYYKAVPDFIDIHFQEFHWFIFNVADIFISLGITCLIFVEIFSNKKVTNEIN